MEITEAGHPGRHGTVRRGILIAADTMVLAAGSRNRRAEAMQFNNCAGFCWDGGRLPGPKKIKGQAVAAGYYQAMDI